MKKGHISLETPLEEQTGTFYFLVGERLNFVSITMPMQAAVLFIERKRESTPYGGSCVSRSPRHEWGKYFGYYDAKHLARGTWVPRDIWVHLLTSDDSPCSWLGGSLCSSNSATKVKLKWHRSGELYVNFASLRSKLRDHNLPKIGQGSHTLGAIKLFANY